ncbi:MAG: M4 family metallopeptidase [Bacteroidetes bacterium]|nr:M4 family metallopeptidase [Bacteroidota bacterium]
MMKTFVTIFILLVFSLANYEISGQNKSSSAFKDAALILDQKTNSPKDIRFEEGNYTPLNSFFDEYKIAFNWSNDNETRSFRVLTDKLGQTHFRYKQYYKGIELADVQFILHEKNGLVFHANGMLIHGLDLEVTPSLSESDALQYALSNINAEAYMWENKKNEAYIKREQNDPDATMFPRGVLMLSAKNFDFGKDNFHLVYRFDIYSEKPMDRYYIDVDAKTGEIINKISRIRTGDVPGQGTSVYNGTVSLTVADTAISSTDEPNRWHVDSWNAYQSGLSWWDADPSLGNQGGYGNGWYEGLDTDPISLSGSDLKLEFYHRYKVEEPSGVPPPYNGWDGMNVRISIDGGSTWQVLENPVPAYSNSSLYSFGVQHGEGPDIPGWTGELSAWTKESFDLSAYAGQTVRIRFAFASDPALATEDLGSDLFGWQIDNIVVSNSSTALYSNDGDVNGITTVNLVKEASFIEGNYRLRQYGRGGGIATYDAKNGTSFPLSVDFVDADSSFDSNNGKAGVSVHWALENTYDYYFNDLGRDSFDDNGRKMIAYVHFADEFFNAFWDGSRMIFGDGISNNTPLVSIDIVSHEFTHGVTEYTADLIYRNEYGALNESFSDIFATAVEFYTIGSEGNWFIGEGVFRFRSMSDPNQYEDPDTYHGQNWAFGTGDNGGVHTNSGVQNFWFYLLSEGGSGVNDNGQSYSVTGLGIDQAGQIAYRNLSTYLIPTSEYEDARLGSMYAAIDLYGDNSQQFQSVVEAWNAVGVLKPALFSTVGIDSDTVNFFAEASIAAGTVKVSISNNGFQVLEINDIRIEGSDFQLLTVPVFPVSINYAENITVVVVFSPVQQGEQFGTLSIFSNDPDSPNKTIVLKGDGYIVNPALNRVMYATSGLQNEGNILFINKNSGEGTNIGPSSFTDILGITISPLDKKLYAVRSSSSESQILKVNSLQGDSYVFYTFELPSMAAISFDTSGTLYGALESGEIYSIDLTNGTYDSISTAPIEITAIAFEPMTNDLWAAIKGGFRVPKDKIYKINLTTGDTSFVGQTGFNKTTNDLAFDENGVLYGIKGTGSQVSDLFTIDVNTGEGTIIGPVGLKALTGLAYADTGVTSVEGRDDKLIPTEFILSQNYPNPFNPSTSIEFSVPVNSNVRLTIYNLLGQVVTTLVSEELSAGNYNVIWNGTDNNGLQVSSGVYLYKMKANGNNGTPYSQTKKMILLK